ncbi:MAG: DUF2299 family protein [Candidatus Hydrothermarchaeaceae archaeon]
MEISNPEQAGEAIRGWLKDNNHSIKEVDDDGANFHFVIDYPIGAPNKQAITQPKKVPGLIVIINNIIIAPDHIKKLKGMEQKAREDFYSYIRRDLLFLENSYNMSINDEGVLERIQFSYEFYFDGLTKTQLFKGLLLNHRTFLYIVLSLRGRFGGSEPSKSDTPPMFG